MTGNAALPGRDTQEHQVMQMKMCDNFLQRRERCLLAHRSQSRLEQCGTNDSSPSLICCVCVCLLLRASPFIIAQHIHEGHICQSVEFTCHQSTSKETSAALTTRCSITIHFMSNSFLLINPNLSLMQVSAKKEKKKEEKKQSRQLLLPFAALWVFASVRKRTRAASNSCSDKDRHGDLAVQTQPEEVPVNSLSATTNKLGIKHQPTLLLSALNLLFDPYAPKRE